jgi:hypothetical protein
LTPVITRGIGLAALLALTAQVLLAVSAALLLGPLADLAQEVLVGLRTDPK